mmetsp:Transcript_110084/g.355307  ORF Transcript_110084/g.355307 Transcript_110084/m.355307 type:complete len:270 (-) Transcript_110084:145-954(-)
MERCGTISCHRPAGISRSRPMASCSSSSCRTSRRMSLDSTPSMRVRLFRSPWTNTAVSASASCQRLTSSSTFLRKPAKSLLAASSLWCTSGSTSTLVSCRMGKCAPMKQSRNPCSRATMLMPTKLFSGLTASVPRRSSRSSSSKQLPRRASMVFTLPTRGVTRLEMPLIQAGSERPCRILERTPFLRDTLSRPEAGGACLHRAWHSSTSRRKLTRVSVKVTKAASTGAPPAKGSSRTSCRRPPPPGPAMSLAHLISALLAVLKLKNRRR